MTEAPAQPPPVVSNSSAPGATSAPRAASAPRSRPAAASNGGASSSGAAQAPTLEQLVAAAQEAAAPPPGVGAGGAAAAGSKRDTQAQEALREFMARKKAKMDQLLRDERVGRRREVSSRRAAVRDMAQRQREVSFRLFSGGLICTLVGHGSCHKAWEKTARPREIWDVCVRVLVKGQAVQGVVARLRCARFRQQMPCYFMGTLKLWPTVAFLHRAIAQAARRLAEQQGTTARTWDEDEREPWHTGLTPSETSLASLGDYAAHVQDAEPQQQYQRRQQQEQQQQGGARAQSPLRRGSTAVAAGGSGAGGGGERQQPLSASAKLAAYGEGMKRHRVSLPGFGSAKHTAA